MGWGEQQEVLAPVTGVVPSLGAGPSLELVGATSPAAPEPSYGALALLGAWWELEEEGLACVQTWLPPAFGPFPACTSGFQTLWYSLCLPPLQETSQSRFSRGGPWPFPPGCFPASCRSCSGPQLLLVFFTVTGMELTKGPWWGGVSPPRG